MGRTHYRTCTLCEAMCGIAIDVAGEEILAIRGDADDPFSRGHICPKAVALKDVHEDPDRLRRPLRRAAAGLRGDRLGRGARRGRASAWPRVQQAHGRDAVAVYQGNPTVHNYGALLFGQVFLRTPAHAEPLLRDLGRPAPAHARRRC